MELERNGWRSRRTAVGVTVAAALLIVVPAVVVAGGSGDDDAPSVDQPSTDSNDTKVTCGGHSWPVSAMEDGADAAVPEAEVRAAFADLLEEAAMDAPPAIREDGPEDASYVVLAADEEEVTLGVGPWSVDGPGSGAMELELERTTDGLRATGWGDCQLEAALPEGRSRVEVSAPRGGVDPTTTEPVVMVMEHQCASGRNPRPFLGAPVIVESEERVMVTLTSEAVRGVATCQSNRSVPMALQLDEPLGARALYDAGTWPPKRIDVGEQAEGWRTLAHDDVLVEVPADWATTDCLEGWVQHGPDGSCGGEVGVSFYGSATFDPAHFPGVLTRSEESGTWGGYVYAGDWAVAVQTEEKELARRILASARVAD